MVPENAEIDPTQRSIQAPRRSLQRQSSLFAEALRKLNHLLDDHYPASSGYVELARAGSIGSQGANYLIGLPLCYWWLANKTWCASGKTRLVYNNGCMDKIIDPEGTVIPCFRAAYTSVVIKRNFGSPR